MTVDSSIPDITIIFYFHLREEKNFFTIRKAIKQIIADPMEIKKNYEEMYKSWTAFLLLL